MAKNIKPPRKIDQIPENAEKILERLSKNPLFYQNLSSPQRGDVVNKLIIKYGWSANQIAAIVGATKNAIIGVRRDFGIAARGAGLNQSAAKPKKSESEKKKPEIKLPPLPPPKKEKKLVSRVQKSPPQKPAAKPELPPKKPPAKSERVRRPSGVRPVESTLPPTPSAPPRPVPSSPPPVAVSSPAPPVVEEVLAPSAEEIEVVDGPLPRLAAAGMECTHVYPDSGKRCSRAPMEPEEERPWLDPDRCRFHQRKKKT